MKKLLPACLDTLVAPDPHEWIPRSFDDFLRELDHIISSCPEGNLLFRGHADNSWILESSFIRACKKLLLKLEPHIRPSDIIRTSVEYHHALFSMLLLKYRLLVTPCAELRKLEKQKGIDALFELMRNYQQYPEKDKTAIKGTFFLDWSKNKDVGLFFANFDSNEHNVEIRKSDGALFVCDMTATGRTLQKRRVDDIIDLMVDKNNDPDKREGFGCPLLFYPAIQIRCERANNQDVVYWAQMDMRYDLEDIWKLQEQNSDKEQYICIKLTLPYESQHECADYLIKNGITHSYLFVK